MRVELFEKEDTYESWGGLLAEEEIMMSRGMSPCPVTHILLPILSI